MARFRGTGLFLTPNARDVAFGTNVRALSSAGVASTNYTVTFTSTTTITQTVNPYTNVSNNATDLRAQLGWALNQLDASDDSMGSGVVVGNVIRKRIVPAGTWSFSCSWSSNAPAALQNYNVTFEYSVYRVASNGGARTLLFSTTSAPQNVALLAANGTAPATSVQPEYLIDTDETLHVALRITSNSTTAPIVGGTDTVVTINGTSATYGTVTLPAPGLRDYYLDSNTSEGTGNATRTTRVFNAKAAKANTVSSIARQVAFFRDFFGTGKGTGTRTLKVSRSIEAIAKAVNTRTLLVTKNLIQSEGAGFSSRFNLVIKRPYSSIGTGTGSLAKQSSFFRSFDATGDGDLTFSRVVIFVRQFDTKAINRIFPRIDLPFNRLPDGGGGGQIIRRYTPIFISDD